MANTTTNKPKLGGILSLIFAGLLTGGAFLGSVKPNVAQYLTAGAVALAAFSQKLNIPGSQGTDPNNQAG